MFEITGNSHRIQRSKGFSLAALNLLPFRKSGRPVIGDRPTALQRMLNQPIRPRRPPALATLDENREPIQDQILKMSPKMALRLLKISLRWQREIPQKPRETA